MKAQVWELHVTEGVLAACHGFYRAIIEFYIPELKLAVNAQAYFITGPDRYGCDEDTEFSGAPPVLIETIELDSEVTDALRVMADGCRAYDAFKEKMFDSEENDASSIAQD